jgi:mevalonate kinase
MIRGAGFGHGKIILIGEHGVVHGQPALAAGLAVGVRVEATSGSGRLSVPAWSLSAEAGDGSPVGRALTAMLARLGASALDFHADAAIPSRAGLGSSAAMAVAIARAAAVAVGVDGSADAGAGAAHDDAASVRLRQAVDDAETIFHGTPSGIDAAAALGGGVGRFRRGEGWRPIAVAQSMRVCVGLTGRGRDTSAQVAGVGRLRERVPAVDKILALFGDLADAGERALAVGDIDGLGRLFDVAHGLLGALRVSSPEIETLVHGARAAGAVGAKLTGAGGGGAVIALAPGHESDVIARWRRDGFDGFVTAIGNPDSMPLADHGHHDVRGADHGRAGVSR